MVWDRVYRAGAFFWADHFLQHFFSQVWKVTDEFFQAVAWGQGGTVLLYVLTFFDTILRLTGVLHWIFMVLACQFLETRWQARSTPSVKLSEKPVRFRRHLLTDEQLI
jgi:hypothetical protein